MQIGVDLPALAPFLPVHHGVNCKTVAELVRVRFIPRILTNSATITAYELLPRCTRGISDCAWLYYFSQRVASGTPKGITISPPHFLLRPPAHFSPPNFSTLTNLRLLSTIQTNTFICERFVESSSS